MTETPNILLVVLDSVRARNTSLHGHVNKTTPFLEQFAEEAIVYDQARSPSVRSRPSHASLFTGYHAAEHNLRDRRELRPGVTIWEELQDDHEFRTGVFSHNPFLSTGSCGLVRGFDTTRTTPTDFVNLPFSEGMDPYRVDGISSVQEGIDHALSNDYPVRSLLNGLYVKVSESFSVTGVGRSTQPGISTSKPSPTGFGTFLLTDRGQRVSTSWMPTTPTNRRRSSTSGEATPSETCRTRGKRQGTVPTSSLMATDHGGNCEPSRACATGRFANLTTTSNGSCRFSSNPERKKIRTS